MKEHILVRNNSHVQHALRHLHHQMGFLYHERTHGGKRPFSSSKCDKSFKMTNFLNQHERACTGEKSLKRNHQHVTRHLHHKMVCYIKKELIVHRDHSAAQNVASHLQCQMF